MLIHYDTKIVNKVPELYDHIQNSFIQNTVFYMIDSKYRKTRILKDWIKEQVNNPSTELVELVKDIKGDNFDEIVVNCLRKVKSLITYNTDLLTWDMSERWQTSQETYSQRTGDCEDGAILTYVLCRLKGVPSNRLMILCGDVKGGGHCWLGYKPINYPLNYVFLDWCYWYDYKNIIFRNKFYIDKNNKVHEYSADGVEKTSNYYKVWFGFNEDYNVKTFKYTIQR